MTDYPPNMKLRPIEAWPGVFTANRQVASFSASHSSTLELLDRELRLLDPKDTKYPPTVLQIAMRERDFRVSDGMPRFNAKPEHPGIILSIEPRNRPPVSIPCDTFTRWQDNLRGVAKGMEALRMCERYGIVREDGQAYRGWLALEETPSVDAKAAACAVLARIAWPDEDAGEQAQWAPRVATDPEVGRTTLRRARGNAHPDRHGGDDRRWEHVEAAAKVIGLVG